MMHIYQKTQTSIFKGVKVVNSTITPQRNAINALIIANFAFHKLPAPNAKATFTKQRLHIKEFTHASNVISDATNASEEQTLIAISANSKR